MENNTGYQQDQRALFRLAILSLLVILLLSLFMTGCSYDCEKLQITHYDQVTLNISEIRSSVSVETPQELVEVGGLYHKDEYVYINERGVGIHVIDNRNTASPTFIAFLSIPGNYGMAARQNYLYADSYMDMLVFDISDPGNISLVSRENNAFDYVAASNVYFDSYSDVLYKYEERVETTTECDMDNGSGNGWWGGMEDDAVFISADASGGARGSNGSNTGDAGSMARFVVEGDVLYTVDFSSLNVFDVSDPSSPNFQTQVGIGWGIETIFPYNNHLFIGSQDGMYIFDNANKLAPEYLSVYQHATACDPVVVSGNYAYVTLRDGSQCQTFSNQLDIVDVSDLQNPALAKTYNMLNPHGLGIDGDCLFICEGSHGLKSYTIDPTDPTSISLQNFNKSVHAFDVITLPNTLLMAGNDGFYQYETNCGSDMTYLSKIPF